MRKRMTWDEAARSKEKGARFVETALRDPEHAEAIRDESLDDWIARKTIQIVDNPRSVAPHIIEKESPCRRKSNCRSESASWKRKTTSCRINLIKFATLSPPKLGMAVIATKRIRTTTPGKTDAGVWIAPAALRRARRIPSLHTIFLCFFRWFFVHSFAFRG